MAYTERYVTDAAGGGGAGTEGDPWTLAEGLDQAAAGDRVNIQSDGAYSIGATTQTNAGTQAASICFRGYNSTIGDLDTVGRDTPANGSGLITTNMPAITCTGNIIPAANTIFKNLNFDGAINDWLMDNNAGNAVYLYQCAFLNTNNAAGSGCIRLNNSCGLVMCDFECSGADHQIVVDIDADNMFALCRFEGVDTGVALLQVDNVSAVGNLFINGGVAIALNNVGQSLIMNNTCYNADKFLTTPNQAMASVPIVVNNHVTDCNEFLDNLFSGTANQAIIELFNRTRDNTTARTGIGDGLLIGEVTLDEGDHTTDYTDATTDDFSLISAAPGEDAGLKIG